MAKYSNEILKDIIVWDIKNWSVALKSWDKVLAQVQPGASALEVGAREGGLSLYFALKGFHVVCSDVESPHVTAQSRHKNHRVQHLVNYAAADATRLPFDDCRFDVVAFKSILGTIGRNDQMDQQAKAISEIYRVLKPGGILLFAENLTGTALHGFFRKMTKWGGYWRYVTIDEMQQFHGRFTQFNYATFGFLSTFGRNEFQRRALHHIDKLIDPILKDHHKYIIFGHARK